MPVLNVSIFHSSGVFCTMTCKLKQVKPNLLLKPCWSCYVKLPIKVLQIVLFNVLMMICVTFATAFRFLAMLFHMAFASLKKSSFIMSIFFVSKNYHWRPYLSDFNAFSLYNFLFLHKHKIFSKDHKAQLLSSCSNFHTLFSWQYFHRQLRKYDREWAFFRIITVIMS